MYAADSDVLSIASRSFSSLLALLSGTVCCLILSLTASAALYRNERLLADPTRFRQISERIPAGRWGNPEDFAGPVVFLASSASQYVCGELLVVDGVCIFYVMVSDLTQTSLSGLDGSLGRRHLFSRQTGKLRGCKVCLRSTLGFAWPLYLPLIDET